MSKLRTVVIDASPLLDRSGHRGIGRYVYDLLHGLEATRDEWSSRLDISAVTDLGWLGNGESTRELARAAEGLRPRRGTEKDRIIKKRRLSLGRFTRGADILHLSEPIGMPLFKRTRWAVTAYDLIPLRMPEEYLGGRRLRIWRRHAEDVLRYHRADRIMAISERTRQDLIELLGISEEKVVAVQTGIDVSHWVSAPQPGDRDRVLRFGVGHRPYLLFVGEGDQRKGVAAMIGALAEARRHVDVELVWAGQLPPDHLARFREQVRQSGVTDHVRFIGFAPDPDLAALYRGALAHVFLSVLEGFGLPVAEAISAGCPVIVVKGSGCDELAGEAGYLVAPNDAEAAARAIVRLATDPEDRASRIRLGLSRARRCDRREMARGYAENWLSMLTGP